jgi:hypothetical protein
VVAASKSLNSHPDLPQDFSLVLGGPLFQLLRRAHLSGNSLELLRHRIFVFIGITWLPPLVLSIVEGHALGRGTTLPFLGDVEANLRFLVALPLLIMSELVVHRRMRLIVTQFLERHLIPESELPRFDATVASAVRLRNSVVAEVALMAFVYGIGVLLFWRNYVAVSTPTWYAVPEAGGLAFSLAGRWYVYLSVPIFQFLLMRWYFRLFIWARFLWQVSRIDLRLVPTHPDRVGGLGFLSTIAYAFTPLAAAHGVMLAGPIANRIFYLGAKLTEFRIEIAVLILFLMCLVFIPLVVFSPQLALAKRTGLREYGRLAERYVREFDTKWLRAGAPPEEPLIGSADIQSLADLANSFEVVRTMQLAPITRDAMVRLLGATIVPLLPLILTMISLQDLLQKLFGMLL